MSTKAQDFKVEQQRSAHPPRPKSAKKLAKVQARLDGLKVLNGGRLTLVSAGSGIVPADGGAERHRSDRAARRGGSRMEGSESGKPSRKSTRKSEGHIKLASNLTRQTIRKASAPKTRAAKAAARGQR